MRQIPLSDIQSAAASIYDVAVRTPLVRMPLSDEVGRRIGGSEIFLKLETLQPVGSFKIRGAWNAVRQLTRDELRDGVWTVSAGNAAQGVALAAQRAGTSCSVMVMDTAPQAKLDAIQRLGAAIVPVTYDECWATAQSHSSPRMRGHFVHPIDDDRFIAGNATIGLEILEDLPDVDAVYVPCGGGGLASGIASALRASGRDVPLHAVQPDTAAPLAAAFAAGEPTDIAFRPSFVDGAGAKLVLPRMWPRLRALVASAPVVSLDQVADAIRLLVERVHAVAEGAGALAVAAALADPDLQGKVVAVVSGGNIDSDVLCRILSGATP
jgi:threonine dehydratase